MKNKIDIKRVWVYIFLLFILLISILGIKSLIFSFFIFCIIFLIIKNINISKFPLFLFLLTFLIRLIFVLLVDTPPESDFSVLLNASRNLIDKDYSFLGSNYFKLWTYQVGFVYVQSLFLRIFNNVIFLKIINSLISSVTTLLIYYISREFVSYKSSKTSSLIYALLPFTITYVTILSNQYLFSFLIYIAIYLLIKKDSKLNEKIKYLLSGLLIALANVIRPESIIPLFSIVLYLLITINKLNFKINLRNIFLILGTYIVAFFGISLLFNVTSLAPGGLKNNDVYWKFVCGLNQESNGSYAFNHEDIVGNMELEKAVIKEDLSVGIFKIFKLFKNKIRTFWLSTYLNWSFNFIYDNNVMIFNHIVHISTIVSLLTDINNYVMYMLYILLIYGVYKYIRKKKYNEKILILINQVFITYGVYLLIEVQPRYSYHIMVSIVILSSLGIEEVLNYIKTKKIKKEVIK